MKKTTLFSIILVVAFFLPWVDFSFITFSGYELPKAIHQLSTIGGGGSSLIFLVYLVYLIPIFSILNIASDFKLISFSQSFKKFDFYLAVLLCIYIIYTAIERGTDIISFLGIGFFVTSIISILGLFVMNDKVIFEMPKQLKNNSNDKTDLTAQLQKLKELYDKELISSEEYQMKKQEILNKLD